MKVLVILALVLPALVTGGKIMDMLPDLDEALACKVEGEVCHGFPTCCENMQCYWENKWNPLAAGRCVQCVPQGDRCQRNGQCCEGYQCDKDVVTDINGFCQPPRRNGNICHKDSMCEGTCDKRWYQLYGECV